MSRGRREPEVPFITADQMREVDRLMIEEYGILLVQMMEHAGSQLAHLARSRFLDGDPRGKRVLVLSGTGGNGGGGLVCARRLHSWGAHVTVHLSEPASELSEIPLHQFAALERPAVEVKAPTGEVALAEADLIVEALIGYGLRGAPAGNSAALIRVANLHGAPALALDVPSGLDSTTGVVHDPTIRATATMTLALPKTGLGAESARTNTGELYLADIGVPPELYAEPKLALSVGPIFAKNEVVRLS